MTVVRNKAGYNQVHGGRGLGAVGSLAGPGSRVVALGSIRSSGRRGQATGTPLGIACGPDRARLGEGGLLWGCRRAR